MKKSYDYDVQKNYLELMLANPESFVRCSGIFDFTLFDRKLQMAAEFIKLYADEYNTLPDSSMVNANCQCSLIPPTNLNENQINWFLDEFERFIRHKALERAILESYDLLNQQEYGTVEKKIKDAVQIGLTRDLGTNYYENPTERLNALKDRNGQITTGWKALDDKLYGGFNRGELNIFAACSGGGKSLFLANLALNFSSKGYNVVYITLELNENLVSMRIDSMLTGISTRNIFKQLPEVYTAVKLAEKTSGKIQVKYLPSGKTANDIRAYLKEYSIKSGNKIDVLLVDYLDLLSPNGKKVSAENLFVKDKYVSEDLRNLAMEYQFITISASQLNRTGTEESTFEHSHIAGGISKIHTADNLFGIYTSIAMKERGRYQLQLMKTRNSGAVGHKIDLAFDIDTLRITDVPDDEQSEESFITQSTTDLIQNIKQRNTEPKIKATSDSSKVRHLLNTLNP